MTIIKSTIINNPEHAEAFRAVEKINDELYEKYSKKDPKNFDQDSLDKMPIVAITIGTAHMSIKLHIQPSRTMPPLEIPIYHSFEEEDRIYYENSGKYESFYKFIKRKFRAIKEELYAIKI